ncbi:MAG: ComEC family competence protein [Alkalinema sp. RU_4_3]|nr:ComEC family competence protein [Alkalinema sp. RU_4_3]
MNVSTVFCLAYIAGLLLTALGNWMVLGLWIAGFFILVLYGMRERFGQQQWTVGMVVMLVVAIAPIYYQLRLPQPEPQDISRYAGKTESVTVIGTVETLPKLTRSQKMQTWLKVKFIETPAIEPATGKLYLTMNQAQGADLVPGQRLKVTGMLYKPQGSQNPGGFDFRQYLARSGSFAGFRAEQVEMEKPPTGWALWQWQRRIVRGQAAQLPYPEGAVVSAMVLGSQGVDIPFEVKDQFTQVGLSHALAASGFQTSLILGVVLGLTKAWPKRFQVGLGAIALCLFLGLTGLQPSVLRAGMMGGAVLVALGMERTVKPLGALLMACVVLLFVNPGWIWDLGFGLSVLATLGLLVTVPWLSDRLDWLPGKLQAAVAVPLAAMVWTMPLQLWQFGMMSPYGLIANVVVTPLISILSLGGMVSAMAVAIVPQFGFLTSWLHFPCAALLWVVDMFCKLPGSTVAVGTISGAAMVGVYAVMVVMWQRPDWRKFGGYGLVAIALVIMIANRPGDSITALATSDQPVLVVQQQQVGLINSGSETTAQMMVAPFLQQQGINRLHWGLAMVGDRAEENAWGNLGHYCGAIGFTICLV